VVSHILRATILVWGASLCAAFYRPEDYVMRRTPQYMRHHGITDNWRWSPGYVGEEEFHHAPPQLIRATLYPKGYCRWGQGLDKVPALEQTDLDALARENHWKAIRKLLQKAVTDANEELLGKKTYLRLIAHSEGVGATPCKTRTQ